MTNDKNYNFLQESNFKAQTVKKVVSQYSKDQDPRLSFDSMELNIINNFLYRNQPYLNNFLIYGDSKLSDFHDIFWRLYEHEGYSFIKAFDLNCPFKTTRLKQYVD